MKIIAINGSPRTGGNTEILLNKVMEPLKEAGWETELIKVGGTALRGCTGCCKCRQNQDRRCVIKGDSLNEILPRVFDADAILLGSPTYYSDITSEMKAFIDRTGYVAGGNGRLLSGKIGAAVTAVRRGGSTHAFDSMNRLFLISRMIVPGSSYWNMGFGREPGEVLQDAEGLVNMRDLGRNIAYLGEIIQGGVEFPAFEG